METTPFDLNRTIQHWRENLAQSPAFRSENVAELESHLRDSVAGLQTHGLSAEEAFMVAAKRIGKGTTLETEFAKVNGQSVWLDRLLWIVIAVQGWLVISTATISLVTVAAGAAVAINHALPNFGVQQVSDEFVRGVFGLLVFPAPTMAAAAVVWWLLNRSSGRLGVACKKLLRRPVALALTLFLFCTILQATTHWALYSWIYPRLYNLSGSPAHSHLMNLLSYLPQYVLLAALTLFVARKRLRLSKA